MKLSCGMTLSNGLACGAMGDEPLIRAVRLRRKDIPTFDSYPFSTPAVRGLARLDLSAPVTLFAGENGSGKSTLIEAIAVAVGFNPEGGSKNMTVATRPSHSALHEYLRVIAALVGSARATSFVRRASSTWRPTSKNSMPRLAGRRSRLVRWGLAP